MDSPQAIREKLALLLERKGGMSNICRCCLGSGYLWVGPLSAYPKREKCWECGGSGKRPDMN